MNGRCVYVYIKAKLLFLDLMSLSSERDTDEYKDTQIQGQPKHSY